MSKRIYLKLVMVLAPLALSCVDKVDLSLPDAELPVIVDGMISDLPGPDTVRLSKAYPADGGFYRPRGISGVKIAVTDDTGFVDSLIDLGQGEYVTNLLNGVVGRTYQLSILFPDTIDSVPSYTLAISTPQLLVEAGSIDTIYYEYETRNNPDTGIPDNGFNIYVNSTLRPGSSRRIQWQFFGTYKTMTDPASLVIPLPGCTDIPCPSAPLPCSENCECCTCWYTTRENAPIISTPNILGGYQLDRVFMVRIPINRFTFYERYRVEISQLELSEEVFEFYKAIRKQSDNANSIFQPPFFELKGNVSVQYGPRAVIGTFAASTIVKRHIYISRNAVPYQLATTLEPADCRAIADNATLTMPPYWQ